MSHSQCNGLCLLIIHVDCKHLYCNDLSLPFISAVCVKNSPTATASQTQTPHYWATGKPPPSLLWAFVANATFIMLSAISLNVTKFSLVSHKNEGERGNRQAREAACETCRGLPGTALSVDEQITSVH